MYVDSRYKTGRCFGLDVCPGLRRQAHVIRETNLKVWMPFFFIVFKWMVMPVLLCLWQSLLFPCRVKSSTFIPSTALTIQGMHCACAGALHSHPYCFKWGLCVLVLGVMSLALCWMLQRKCRACWEWMTGGWWRADIDPFGLWDSQQSQQWKNWERTWKRPKRLVGEKRSKLVVFGCHFWSVIPFVCVPYF